MSTMPLLPLQGNVLHLLHLLLMPFVMAGFQR
jgi:hypothetical protein